MQNDKVTYYNEGYIGTDMEILEIRVNEKGMSKFLWRGLYNGGNHIKLIPMKPVHGFYDNIKRRTKILSLYEIERRKDN